MNFAGTVIGRILSSRSRRANLVTLARMLVLVVGLMALFTAIFFFFMALEGRTYSVISAIYWTCTVMTTLGFGDIIFVSDGGRAFSAVVMVTGMLIQSVILPFIVIEFLWSPWVESQRIARIPRQIDPDVQGHVLITGPGVGIDILRSRLTARRISAWIIDEDEADAAARHDRGEQIMAGTFDDPSTWARAGLARAALVICNRSETENALTVVTIREINPRVQIMATADHADHVEMSEVLRKAGADVVVRPRYELGLAMAHRVRAGNGFSPIGKLGDVEVAAITVASLDAVGRSLAELDLPARHHVQVIAIWERGRSLPAIPSHLLDRDDILVLAGPHGALSAFAQRSGSVSDVIVVGAGVVAQAAVEALRRRGAPVVVVATCTPAWIGATRLVVGMATNASVLEHAGLAKAAALLVATSNDSLNIAITLRARLLRDDIEIVARVGEVRNVSSCYRSGADLVICAASLFANSCFNLLRLGQVMLVAEGLFAIHVSVPRELAGRRLAEANIRAMTGLTVVSVQPSADSVGPNTLLPAGGHLTLAGPEDAVNRWFARYHTQATENTMATQLLKIIPVLRTKRS